MLRWMTLVSVLSLMPITASAEDAEVSKESGGPTIGVGARIGGYGFRDISDGNLSWAECRMNGMGLLGTVDLGRHIFGELAADFYHATGSSSMDRISFLPAAAIGVRMLPGKLVSPYIQAGGGPEFTRIDLNDQTAKKVLPTAFMGVGGELNIKQLHFGTNLKFFTMGLPTHAHGVVQAHLEPEGTQEGGEEEIEIRYDVAAQMQFFVRYTF